MDYITAKLRLHWDLKEKIELITEWDTFEAKKMEEYPDIEKYEEVLFKWIELNVIQWVSTAFFGF